MLIEQAIFTSVASQRACGYQIASRSNGLSEADARELALWGPSHDSLLETGRVPAQSTNFNRLASGAYCVSRTTAAGAEYSGRGGAQVYTQMLVVPAQVLERFANNPFAILRAASAKGALCVHDSIPKELPALELGGRTAVVDQAIVAQVARNPGPDRMAALVQAAHAADRLAISWSGPMETLLAGLFSLLPIECRASFSFTTGLKVSPARPTRLIGLADDIAAIRGLTRQSIMQFDADRPVTSGDLASSGGSLPARGWACHVRRMLTERKLSALATQLETRRPWLNLSNLNTLAEQIATPVTAGPALEPVAVAVDCTVSMDAVASSTAAQPVRRGSKFEVEDLGELLASQPADVVEKLERVDDLLFAAISGSEPALDELRQLWPNIASELEPKLVERSAKQYLRCALAICSQAAGEEPNRAERALAAIDVLCVLYD